MSYSQPPPGAYWDGYQYQQAPPPQPPYYGHQQQPAYPAAPPPQAYAGYDQGQQSGYYQQQPAYAAPVPQHPPHDPHALRPPPDVATDPNSFRRFFSDTLRTLHFNSKPVITNLTLFAHQHSVRMSGVVALALKDHLEQCPPTYKLPALYLLDSISKNIGPPYIVLFSRFIERVFLSAYHVVDPSTKLKMEELLGTWRTGGSDGGELFRTPEEGPRGRVQRGIESVLFGEQPQAATPAERSSVLFDIRRLLHQREQQAFVAPADSVNAGQISALKQLESLVLNTQLTSEQVQQIRGQLAALGPPAEASPPPPEVVVKQEPGLASYQGTPEPPSLGLAGPPPAPAPAIPAFDPARLAELLSPNRGATPTVIEPTPPPPSVIPPTPSAPTATAPGHGIDLSLLASLQSSLTSGSLSSLFAPAPQQAAPAASIISERSPLLMPDPAEVAAQKEREAREKKEREEMEMKEGDKKMEEYDQALIQMGVGLTNKEVATFHEASVHFLYTLLPLQCKQCGLRFFDTPRGKQQLDVHLDWHFTHKRRIREGAARPQGRSWLSLEEDWIHSDDHLLLDDPLHPGLSASNGSTSQTKLAASAAASLAIDKAALRKKKVPAPTDDPVKLAKPCPVCKEKWKAEFEEEEEEWVFWNAVDVDGVLYHATCHAEATASRASNRLKAEAASDSARASRENTPLGPGATAEGGSAKKRKAEESVKEEPKDEPIGAGVPVKLEEEPTDDPRRPKRVKSDVGAAEEKKPEISASDW